MATILQNPPLKKLHGFTEMNSGDWCIVRCAQRGIALSAVYIRFCCFCKWWRSISIPYYTLLSSYVEKLAIGLAAGVNAVLLIIIIFIAILTALCHHFLVISTDFIPISSTQPNHQVTVANVTAVHVTWSAEQMENVDYDRHSSATRVSTNTAFGGNDVV